MAYKNPADQAANNKKNRNLRADYFKKYFRDYYQKNKVEVQAYNKEYCRTHREERWEKKLKSVYGPDGVQLYKKLLKDQHGKCALCGTGKLGHHRHFQMDHKHVPGFDKEPFTLSVKERSQYLRGLLCHTCNKALGLLKDNPILLRVAASYVETHDNRIKGSRNNRCIL